MRKIIGKIETLAAGLIRPFIINSFHRIYYNDQGWQKNSFLGRTILQNPLDLHLYQELFFCVRPHCVIQTGVAFGGSILFLASLLDLIGSDPSAFAVGIDIQLTEQAEAIKHPRIRLIEGSSTDSKTINQVRRIASSNNCMVILDSDHTKSHVQKELELYSDLVSVGSYLVVEDTNVNGHPVFFKFGPGPYEAVEEFLKCDGRFKQDDFYKKNLFSHHHWLKRIH
jgi:cephalosporin hydroxylase